MLRAVNSRSKMPSGPQLSQPQKAAHTASVGSLCSSARLASSSQASSSPALFITSETRSERRTGAYAADCFGSEYLAGFKSDSF